MISFERKCQNGRQIGGGRRDQNCQNFNINYLVIHMCVQIGCCWPVAQSTQWHELQTTHKNDQQNSTLKHPMFGGVQTHKTFSSNIPFSFSPIQTAFKFNFFFLSLSLPYLCIYVYKTFSFLPSSNTRNLICYRSIYTIWRGRKRSNHVRFGKIVDGFKVCSFSVLSTSGNSFNGAVHPSYEQ